MSQREHDHSAHAKHAAHGQPEVHGQHGGHAHDHGAGGHHRFDDPAKWSAIFDDPTRDAWQQPDDVVRMMSIKPGMRVADIGAGTGYFLERLATAVGPKGHVDLIDLEPTMVAHMNERAKRAGFANAVARVTKPDSPGLTASTDRVLIVNTWHHIENRAAWLAALAPTLAPGGTVTVVDFTLASPMGPPPEMRLEPDAVVAEFAAAGFQAAIVAETLPHQYVIYAKRQ